VDSLLDIEGRLDLAEQYAEGGMLLLAAKMDEPIDFAWTFAGDIKQMADGLVESPPDE
jgi:hypothetical protein